MIANTTAKKQQEKPQETDNKPNKKKRALEVVDWAPVVVPHHLCEKATLKIYRPTTKTLNQTRATFFLIH